MPFLRFCRFHFLFLRFVSVRLFLVYSRVVLQYELHHILIFPFYYSPFLYSLHKKGSYDCSCLCFYYFPYLGMIVKPALSASVISENVISLSPIVMLLSLIITFFMVINRPFFFYFLHKNSTLYGCKRCFGCV